ncbi:WbbJ Acetyltransferase (isoleucine patch superfamily) [Methylophilaceae bacterium]
MILIQRIIKKIHIFLRKIYSRFFYSKAFLLSSSIFINNSKILISEKCKIRGIIYIENSVFQIGIGSIIHKSANLEFVGKNSAFYGGSEIKIGANADIGGGKITIGDSTTIAPFFICIGDVTIGKNTLIAPRVFISSGSHTAKTKELIRDQEINGLSKPVVIGNDCWLGVNSIILPGVSLGNGCVVGAGSVVTKSFPDYAVLVGSPAKIIRFRA